MRRTLLEYTYTLCIIIIMILGNLYTARRVNGNEHLKQDTIVWKFLFSVNILEFLFAKKVFDLRLQK